MKHRWTAMTVLALFVCGMVGAGVRERVGEELVRRVETQHPYRGPGELEKSAAVRSETFHYDGATYIAVHFESFRLADGDYLIVRSPDGSQSWRYEGLGRAELGMSPGGFWATHIKGDTALVELYSRHDVGDHGYVIDKFARGFTESEMLGGGQAGAAPDGTEALCGADDSEWAKCYQSSEPEIYEKGRAVSRLLILGSFVCTGWLLGCEGHLVTNNHCIGNQNEANNTDFEFMAEGATCATNCFGFGCPGTIEATSGTLVKTNGSLDYSLVQLPGNLSATYGFMSFRETGPVVNERIYIPQHPAGWGKRFAVFSTAAQDQSGFCEVLSLNSPPCTGGPGDIGYYCDTQGGSSGSPVLGYSDHKVVSLHHCGDCPNRGLDPIDLIAHIGSDMPECGTEDLVGSVSIDATEYACSDLLTITVKDDSLQGAATHQVSVDSDTEVVGESVTLTATPPGSGTFIGAVQLVDGAAAADGLLSVSDGDTITVTYLDEDDGQGGVNVPRQATADADCSSPAISAVAAVNVGGASATITWGTDEPATSLVTFGETPPGSSTAEQTDLVTSHSVGLGGLLECREYFFWVSSADAVGNTSSDDNGGTYYSFETICTPPPTVPGGEGGATPLTVERLTADASQLRLHWDNQCVAAPGTAKILHGPLAQVSTLDVSGAVCSIPVFASPKSWSGVPAGDLWFVMSGDNGFGHEGSWGTDSLGQERNGAVPSGECGSFEKDLAGTCP